MVAGYGGTKQSIVRSGSDRERPEVDGDAGPGNAGRLRRSEEEDDPRYLLRVNEAFAWLRTDHGCDDLVSSAVTQPHLVGNLLFDDGGVHVAGRDCIGGKPKWGTLERGHFGEPQNSVLCSDVRGLVGLSSEAEN